MKTVILGLNGATIDALEFFFAIARDAPRQNFFVNRPIHIDRARVYHLELPIDAAETILDHLGSFHEQHAEDSYFGTLTLGELRDFFRTAMEART